MSDAVQMTNDMMWGAKDNAQYQEMVLQKLLRDWVRWEDVKDKHDCTLSPEDSCQTCENYELWMAKNIYE